MANETTAADLGQGLVRENWGPRYISALYEETAVLPNMLNVTGDFKGMGDIANIAVEPTLTVGAIASDGSLNVQEVSITNATVVIDKNKDVTAELVGIAREQAYKNFEEQFPISAGKALRQKMELDALALQSGITTTAISDGTAQLGEDDYLAAIQACVTAKLPILEQPDKFCFALADTCFAPVRKLGLLDYNRTGEAGQGGAAGLKLPSLWNVPVKFSTQVATSGTFRANLLFHETAFAWAVQRNVVPRFADRLAAAKDSYIMTVLGLYGVATINAGRGFVLKSKA